MADYEFITATGTVLPDTSTLLADVQDEFREAFGADLVVTPDTPQGVLITAEALARDAVARNNAALANQINPNLAGGVFLDALWALTGGARVRATFSLVTGVELTGAPGAVIPAGAIASVGDGGARFELTGAVDLGAGGAGVGTFQALESGPVAAAIGALNWIVSGVLGWETVTNPAAAVPGLSEESDLAARRRRRGTLALQSVALAESIVSGLNDVEGVRSVLFRENVTNAPLVIEGYALDPHSVLAVVSGGTDLDVATTLLARKSCGAAWNGTTVVNVLEPVSGQTYPVRFLRPTLVPIFVEVTVRLAGGAVVSDPAQAVRDALMAYAGGQLANEDGWTIGTDASPFELASAINSAAPGLFVTVLEIGLALGVVAAATLPITIIQQAQLIEGNISVTVI
jgi:hypothetical protein